MLHLSFHGGCSSGVERLTVAQEVAGSRPVTHPKPNTCLAAVMSKQIEVSLRIPNSKIRPLDENGYPIDHASVRFKKVIEVESIPRAGDSLTLPTASGRLLPSSVVSANWHDSMGMFVVACQYGNKSLVPDDYSALVSDPDWRMTPLI